MAFKILIDTSKLPSKRAVLMCLPSSSIREFQHTFYMAFLFCVFKQPLMVSFCIHFYMCSGATLSTHMYLISF